MPISRYSLLIILPILFFLSENLWANTPELNVACWWKMLGQTSAQDTGMNTTLELHCPVDKKPIGTVEVYYQTRPWERVDRALKFGQAKVFRKILEINESPAKLDFFSGQAENIEVWAKAEIDGKTYVSGTVFNNYARGKNASLNSETPETASPMPRWPTLGILPQQNFYFAQTGQTITLEPSGFSPETISVYRDKKSVALIRNHDDHDGQFQYTPPHDPELSKLKFSDFKDLVFVADLPSDAGQVSFYLPLHRAYRGQIDLKSGLMVLLGSILLSLGWVFLKNRSFRWRTA